MCLTILSKNIDENSNKIVEKVIFLSLLDKPNIA